VPRSGSRESCSHKGHGFSSCGQLYERDEEKSRSSAAENSRRPVRTVAAEEGTSRKRLVSPWVCSGDRGSKQPEGKGRRNSLDRGSSVQSEKGRWAERPGGKGEGEKLRKTTMANERAANSREKRVQKAQTRGRRKAGVNKKAKGNLSSKPRKTGKGVKNIWNFLHTPLTGPHGRVIRSWKKVMEN